MTFVSDQVEEILGFLPGAIQGATGDTVFSTIHPDDREAGFRAAQRVYDDGRPNTARFRWMAQDGRPVWVQSYFCAIEKDGQVVGLRGVTIVVNEQQRTEELLDFVIEAGRILASSLDYDSTLRNVARLAVPTVADWCAVHVIDENGILQPVSVAHENPDKVAWVMEMQEMYRDMARPANPSGPALVVQTGESQFIPEITPEVLDAAITHPEVRTAIEQVGLRSYMCVPMILHETVTGVISFAAAESGRRFSRNDLRAAEHLARRAAAAISTSRAFTDTQRERARFRAIVSWLDQAVCHVDSAGRVEHMNPAAEALLGFSTGDLRGKVFHEAVHLEMDEDSGCRGEACTLVRVFTTLKSTRGTELFRSRQGQSLSVRASCVPIVLADQPLGAIISFEDISDELEASVRKDSFLAFAAHELRTPLTPMIGLSRWLARKVNQAPAGTFDQDFAEVVETLQSESARMGNIVEVFLDLSRIESNRLTLEPTQCELRALVNQTVRQLKIRYPNALVELNLPEEELSVFTDEGRLQQVLRNLLENAAKYGGEPPEISITLTKTGGTARITVRDNGHGIPEEEHALVFERFYRSQAANTKKGLGVGLYLAREIVEQLGGELSLVSPPGEGAEFTIQLPHQRPGDQSSPGDAASGE